MCLFKQDFLSRFDGTDGEEVEQYLGCAVIFDSSKVMVMLRQKIYAERWRYRGIVCHLSFLVSCTRPDLAFTYAELSKFVGYPGVVHLRAAERALQYLMGTYDQGITYRQLDPARRNVLEGWVDSDYAADPDTRC
eukprot:2697957-Rhodomonas_salina.2